MDVVGGAEDAVGTGQHGGARLDHESQLRRQVVGRPEDAVGTGNERVVGFSGTKTVPLPPLVTRSRPWSKNWPKNVNQASNGAD